MVEHMLGGAARAPTAVACDRLGLAHPEELAEHAAAPLALLKLVVEAAQHEG